MCLAALDSLCEGAINVDPFLRYGTYLVRLTCRRLGRSPAQYSCHACLTLEKYQISGRMRDSAGCFSAGDWCANACDDEMVTGRTGRGGNYRYSRYSWVLSHTYTHSYSNRKPLKVGGWRVEGGGLGEQSIGS